MKAAAFGDTGDILLSDAKVPEPRPGWVRLATGLGMVAVGAIILIWFV